jgi:hypothetical protein
MIPRAACRCCGGDCCQCWRGEDRSAGGCCYGTGDRVRLTIPRPPTPAGIFGGASSACYGDCFAPILAHTYCCGSIGSDAADEFWAEYEWQEPCFVAEFIDGQGIIPDPNPILYPPPSPGWTPPEGHDGTLPPPSGTDIYCHLVHAFVAVEYSASAQEWADAGGNLGCIFPLEWWYVCSGCKKFPTMADCALPADHRPESELPCGYTGPQGDFFLAAKEALGWMFVCNPVATIDCPFCIAACWTGDPTPCVSFTTEGQQIFDAFGGPAYCGVNACTSLCCAYPDQADPECTSTITLDLTRCDGGKICCHRRQWRRVSCDIAEGYYCLDLGTTISTLERTAPKRCVWTDGPPARCRTRTASDPIEPLDVPGACPP